VILRVSFRWNRGVKPSHLRETGLLMTH
jgi:hypothetical protein